MPRISRAVPVRSRGVPQVGVTYVWLLDGTRSVYPCTNREKGESSVYLLGATAGAEVGLSCALWLCTCSPKSASRPPALCALARWDENDSSSTMGSECDEMESCMSCTV